MSNIQVNSNSQRIHNNIESLFSNKDSTAKAGQAAGNNLYKAEQNYLKAVSNPNANPGEVAKLEIIYKRAAQMFQSFMQISAAMFDIMRQALSRLSLR